VLTILLLVAVVAVEKLDWVVVEGVLELFSMDQHQSLQHHIQ